jgi:hypothetical protein
VERSTTIFKTILSQEIEQCELKMVKNRKRKDKSVVNQP